MTRRRKDPFAGKENVRHFRLVQRPGGLEMKGDEFPGSSLSFEEMFEEYDPSGSKHFTGTEVEAEEEFYENDEGDDYYNERENENETESYDFLNDDDGEMVDIDAEMDRFCGEYIDIEGEDGIDRVKMGIQVGGDVGAGEAAKYGILLDDREYDYTKHLRRVGVTPGAVFIQAPGMKKITENDKKPRDFFESPVNVEPSEDYVVNQNYEEYVDEDVIKANHEAARQQYRALLQQVGDDPMLKEVIEALEDDRYVMDEIDDELVIELDNLNIVDDEDEDIFFDNEEDIDILNDQEFPEFIPSQASKRQLLKESKDNAKFEDILNEYEEYNSESDYEKSRSGEECSFNGNYKMKNISKACSIQNENDIFIDIEGSDDGEEIYKYLKEHGRARGTTLYEKKRPSHLPPIHIAIAQYDELRRDLAVNNDLIIERYAQEDEEETREMMRESERIISGLVKLVNDPAELEKKRLNIETAQYLLKLADDPAVGPKKIVEVTASSNRKNKPPQDSSESESFDTEFEEPVVPRVNKGVARSLDETVEEKKARKAKIKAEKREKRSLKYEKKKERK